MRIGELADQIGVTTDTIRFYERSGVLPRPMRQRDNNYRDYGDADVEHLRLLIDLRRLDIPLDDAARIAGWCHAGHCGDTTAELPAVLADRRAAIAARIEGLRDLDARLADLERHLARQVRTLNVVENGGAPCCDAASAVTDVAEGCACCAPASVLETIARATPDR
jgi:DNA-binding transcriptional MerR regulator